MREILSNNILSSNAVKKIERENKKVLKSGAKHCLMMEGVYKGEPVYRFQKI